MVRVRVSTDANRLTYTFAGRTARLAQRRPIRTFWVRAPAAPGRYRLVVRVGDRSDQATVVVRGRPR
jgi:hypothetical protein